MLTPFYLIITMCLKNVMVRFLYLTPILACNEQITCRAYMTWPEAQRAEGHVASPTRPTDEHRGRGGRSPKASEGRRSIYAPLDAVPCFIYQKACLCLQQVKIGSVLLALVQIWTDYPDERRNFLEYAKHANGSFRLQSISYA